MTNTSGQRARLLLKAQLPKTQRENASLQDFANVYPRLDERYSAGCNAQ
ncbi:hypothetical protein KCP75_16490 [Salmonella enterica subsp. enterica]|nr:hypothetical protein KCP75_16490 [Salmonella enterica subsp. enterica]